MIGFLIEGDDIVIKNGNLQMIDGDLEICQCIERVITTRQKEFFLNVYHGIDYSEFEKKQPHIEKLKFDIMQAILQDERVKMVENIDVKLDNWQRKAQISFIVKAKNEEKIYGEVLI